MAILLLLSLVVSVIPVFAYGEEYDSSADDAKMASLQAEKEAQTSKRQSAEEKLAQLKEQQAEVIEEKLALEERNDAAKLEIELIGKEIDLYSDMIAEKGKEVIAAQAKEDEQLEKYRVRIRAMEENGDYNILAIILNSDDFSSLLAAMDDYGDVMDSDKVLFDQLKEARMETEAVKSDYEEYKAECEDKQAELQEQQAELEAQIEESEKELEELAAKIEEAEEEQKAAAAAEAAASQSLLSFINDYNSRKAAAAAASVQTQTVTTIQTIVNEDGTTEEVEVTEEVVVENTDSGVYNTGVVGSGSLTWPFPASRRISSTMKYRWGKQHTGIDIDGFNLAGSTIVAADAGTVIKAEWYGSYGNCVIIDHGNGMNTLYGHMASLSVSAGQTVSGGTPVGTCGMTGSATGYHLHFEVIINGSYADPLGYFSGYELEAGAAD